LPRGHGGRAMGIFDPFGSKDKAKKSAAAKRTAAPAAAAAADTDSSAKTAVSAVGGESRTAGSTPSSSQPSSVARGPTAAAFSEDAAETPRAGPPGTAAQPSGASTGRPSPDRSRSGAPPSQLSAAAAATTPRASTTPARTGVAPYRTAATPVRTAVAVVAATSRRSPTAAAAAAAASAAPANLASSQALAVETETAALREALGAQQAESDALRQELVLRESVTKALRAGADADNSKAEAQRAKMAAMLSEQQDQIRMADFSTAVARTRALLSRRASEDLGGALRRWAVAATALSISLGTASRTSPSVTYALPLKPPTLTAMGSTAGPLAAVSFVVGAGSALEVSSVRLSPGRLLMRARDGNGKPIGDWAIAFDSASAFGKVQGSSVPTIAPLLRGQGPPGSEFRYEFAAVTVGSSAEKAQPIVKGTKRTSKGGTAASSTMAVTFRLWHGLELAPGVMPPPGAGVALSPVPPDAFFNAAGTAPHAAAAATPVVATAGVGRPRLSGTSNSSVSSRPPIAGVAHALTAHRGSGIPARKRSPARAPSSLANTRAMVAHPSLQTRPWSATLPPGGYPLAAEASGSSGGELNGGSKDVERLGERVFAWSGGRGGVVLSAASKLPRPSPTTGTVHLRQHHDHSSAISAGVVSAQDAALAAAFLTYESSSHQRGKIRALSLRGALHAAGLPLHGPGARQILHEEESGLGPNATLDYHAVARIARRLREAQASAL